MSCHRYCTAINFNSGNNSVEGQNIDKRTTIFQMLMNSFVEQDSTTYTFIQSGSCDKHFAIVTPEFSSFRNSQFCKSFITGWITFVYSQQTFVVGNQSLCSIYKIFCLNF